MGIELPVNYTNKQLEQVGDCVRRKDSTLPATIRSASGINQYLALTEKLEPMMSDQVHYCSAAEVARFEASLRRFAKASWGSSMDLRDLSASIDPFQPKARKALETRHLAKADSAARKVLASNEETAGQRATADAMAAELRNSSHSVAQKPWHPSRMQKPQAAAETAGKATATETVCTFHRLRIPIPNSSTAQARMLM